MTVGKRIFKLAEKLWPIHRSITGEGFRRSLELIKSEIPEIKIHKIKSGAKVFDWTIPQEWKVNDAWIETPTGERICEYRKNNLHVLGYSIGIKKKVKKAELIQHLHSIESMPEAIPYVTSYYKKNWGFCISDKEKKKLVDGEYSVYIDANHFNGFLNYGEILIPGKSKREIFLSTYLCHPSMANNELSGPCVTTFITKWLLKKKNNFSYRIIFIPETIGSIAYLSKNLSTMKKNIIAGFNITCIGDDRQYSIVLSRKENTLSDKVAQNVLNKIAKNYKIYSWRERGSDERQYCSPNVDLPVCTLMRTKFAEYPEYHSSFDTLNRVVNIKGLDGGFNFVKSCISMLESNIYPETNFLCEPQLSKRKLYPSISNLQTKQKVSLMMDLISYSDGRTSLLDMSKLFNTEYKLLLKLAKELERKGILKISF